MDDRNEQVEALTRQLHELRTAYAQLYGEMERMDRQLARLTEQLPASGITQQATQPKPSPVNVRIAPKKAASAQKTRQSAEDFIGTNLISKIGILITIIGIFIGAKYAIDKELVSPLMRIIGGYLCAGLLIGTGLSLKQKYLQFSAVLVGGGTAVAYFITYTAYSFYNLLPQSAAFLLMLLTTVAAIALALWYNQKIIALLGQVGAYAIPLLLSDGSGKIAVLFTYISIINAGLIVLAFKRQWKLLYHLAFSITWAMYLCWLFLIPVNGKGLGLSSTMLFLSIHFITFYTTFLAYKIVKKELYQLGEIIILLINALTFFLLGYYVISHQFNGVNAPTLFTLSNAAIHLAISYAIYKARLADRSVEQFLLGLGILFISVAIPVRLDGNWVTLLWTIETIILVVVAIRTNRHLYYEIAVTMMMVALVSLLQDRSEEGHHLLWSKYISLAGVALAWVALNKGRAVFPFDNQGTALFSGIFNITLLGCICSEYIFWLNRAGSENQYKLGLTLIGGAYALVILFIGLVRNRKYLRVGAIALFSITIGKLLLYDLAEMSTITKTIVVTLLGVLLLLASFLYHKYKPVLTGKNQDAGENEQNEQTD